MHRNRMIQKGILASLCLAIGAGAADLGQESAGRNPDIVVEVGQTALGDVLGFGWSRTERMGRRRARWIKHLEGDIWVNLDRQSAVHFELVAAPNYVKQRLQNVGLYVNNHFVEEWVCPHEFHFDAYETLIPAAYLKEGRNRITLRMGYRARIRPDKRELSLAVDKISLTYVE